LSAMRLRHAVSVSGRSGDGRTRTKIARTAGGESLFRPMLESRILTLHSRGTRSPTKLLRLFASF
jgi:hypothetical protein